MFRSSLFCLRESLEVLILEFFTFLGTGDSATEGVECRCFFAPFRTANLDFEFADFDAEVF